MFFPLLKASLQDRISLIWAFLFPLIILIVGVLFISSEAYSYRFLLGVIVLSALSFGLMGSAFDYFNLKSTGVFKVISISKVGILNFISVYIAVRSVLTFLIILIIYAIATMGLGYTSGNSLIGFIGFAAALTIISVILGMICGNIGKNAGGVATISNMLLILLVLLSSLFYSLDWLPNWFAELVYWAPVETISRFTLGMTSNFSTIFYTFFLILALIATAFVSFRYE